MGRVLSQQDKIRKLVDSVVIAVNKGRETYKSRGSAFGYAAYSAMDVPDCVDAAMEMLEQWNGHLSVAAIRAIEKGATAVTDDITGRVLERKGRMLTILLPKHWEKL